MKVQIGKIVWSLLRAILTDYPLDPDDVVSVRLRAEVLQPTTEVISHPLAFRPQVCPGLIQEVFRHVHHVHSFEKGQQ